MGIRSRSFRPTPAYVKELAPEVHSISFDWIDGLWILITAPSEDPERDIDREPIQECIPDADDSYGYWLMERLGGEWTDYDFTVAFDEHGEIRQQEAA